MLGLCIYSSVVVALLYFIINVVGNKPTNIRTNQRFLLGIQVAVVL